MMYGIILTLFLLIGTPAASVMDKVPPAGPVSSDETLSTMTTEQLLRNAQEALLESKDASARAALAMLRNRGGSSDPRLPFNEAITAYRMGDYDQARDLFQTATELAQSQNNQELASSAAYNQGNAAYLNTMQALEEDQPQATSDSIKALQTARQQLEKVLNHYREAFGENRDDSDARANAELTWQRMQELKKQEESLEQQQQQQQQQQDQQKQDQQQNQQQHLLIIFDQE